MDRRGWITVGCAAVGLAFLAIVAAAEPVTMFHEPTTTGFSLNFDAPVLEPDGQAEPVGQPAGGFGLPMIGVGAERALVVILTVAVVAFLVWRVRRWLRELDAENEPDFDVLPDVQEAIAAAAAAQRDELTRGTPRNAIVACWVRLEKTIEQAGLTPDRAETSTELTARVLATYTLDRRAIDVLADLYREARFSTHELSEAHRDRAIAALDELHAQLRPMSMAR